MVQLRRHNSDGRARASLHQANVGASSAETFLRDSAKTSAPLRFSEVKSVKRKSYNAEKARKEGEKNYEHRSHLLPQRKRAQDGLLFGDELLHPLAGEGDHLVELLFVEHLVLGSGLHFD